MSVSPDSAPVRPGYMRDAAGLYYKIGAGLDQTSADARYASKSYVDAADATKVNKSGDTLTGPLIAAADPAVALGVATKQYVDNKVVISAAKPGSPTVGTIWVST